MSDTRNQVIEKFKRMELDLQNPISKRDFENHVTTSDYWQYSLFCKNYALSEDFTNQIKAYGLFNFLAYYHSKHGSLHGSNISVWENVKGSGLGLDDISFSDISLYKLESVPLADYNWYSRKFPLNQQHNHLERKSQIRKMILKNQEVKEFFYPPIIGYRFGDDIYVIEGARRISSVLSDPTASIANVEIFVTDLYVPEGSSEPIARNLKYYLDADEASEQKKRYEDLKIKSDPKSRYAIFDYAQKREFLYPDIGQQISAIMKYIMTNDKTDVEFMWNAIQNIKNIHPKT